MLVTCRNCECRQKLTVKCLRCSKEFKHLPLPKEVLEVIPTKQIPVLELAVLEKWAIATALSYMPALQAAKTLGIGKSTLYRKIKEYGLENKKCQPQTTL